MTSLYFVRHAEPDHFWEDDRTRPLTEAGKKDSGEVTAFLRNVNVDSFISSPYVRSYDTIKGSAAEKGLPISTDERLVERRNGPHSNVYGMYQKRWGDFSFVEEGVESIGTVQKRNIEAVFDILKNHEGESVVVGTHGTALSTIQNYFDPSYGCDDFLRMIDFMPYILRMDFEGTKLIRKEELLIIEKEYTGGQRPDKKTT
ncbi:MAG: histidine phosphatase family protein [Oscillospiraceae bacterium]